MTTTSDIAAPPAVAAGTAATTARPSSATLKVEHLQVDYGAIRALRDVSLTVNPGETVAVIGANGAGKSTLMRTLSGLIRPSAGTATFGTQDLTRAQAHDIARGGLLHIPEGRGTLGRLTVEENLRIAYDRDPAPGSSFESACEPVFKRFPRLKERLAQAAGSMSGGEQQQLAMARPLLARPRLLMLDEPSLGLSPVMVSTVFSVLRELRDSGMTILIVEQNARAALKLSNRAYVLKQGRIAHEGQSKALLADDAVLSLYLGG
jgi:branched-chain amino acid transport system ATP-binding protein